MAVLTLRLVAIDDASQIVLLPHSSRRLTMNKLIENGHKSIVIGTLGAVSWLLTTSTLSFQKPFRVHSSSIKSSCKT